MGDYQAASASVARAIELYHQLGYPLGEAEALNTAGDLALASARLSDARASYEKAHKIAVAMQSLPKRHSLWKASANVTCATETSRRCGTTAPSLGHLRANRGTGDAHQAESSMQEMRIATSLIHAVSSPEVGEFVGVVVAGITEGGPRVGEPGEPGRGTT